MVQVVLVQRFVQFLRRVSVLVQELAKSTELHHDRQRRVEQAWMGEYEGDGSGDRSGEEGVEERS